MERGKIKQHTWDLTLLEVRRELDRRLLEKGDKASASLHESWGTIDEEFREFKDAVQANDTLSAKGELLDIVVAAVWALASLEADAERPCRSCGKVGHTEDDHKEVVS